MMTKQAVGGHTLLDTPVDHFFVLRELIRKQDNGTGSTYCHDGRECLSACASTRVPCKVRAKVKLRDIRGKVCSLGYTVLKSHEYVQHD